MFVDVLVDAFDFLILTFNRASANHGIVSLNVGLAQSVGEIVEAKKLFDTLSAKNIIEIALYCHDNAIRECGFHFAWKNSVIIEKLHQILIDNAMRDSGRFLFTTVNVLSVVVEIDKVRDELLKIINNAFILLIC